MIRYPFSYFASLLILAAPSPSILTLGTILRHEVHFNKTVCVCPYFEITGLPPFSKVYVGELPFPFPWSHQANMSCSAPTSTPCDIMRFCYARNVTGQEWLHDSEHISNSVGVGAETTFRGKRWEAPPAKLLKFYHYPFIYSGGSYSVPGTILDP